MSSGRKDTNGTKLKSNSHWYNIRGEDNHSLIDVEEGR